MKTIIIAEAGVNHNGDLSLAYKLVDAAKEAGADFVKFQTFIPNNIASKKASKANYQKDNINVDEKQLDMLEKLALSFDDFKKIKHYCSDSGINFLSTPFDIESVIFLNSLDMEVWKIPSGEITNLPYLIEIAKTKKPVIMSTGMCKIEEIEKAINVLKKYGTTDIFLLHCTTEYPTPFEDVNLKAMSTLRTKFNVEVGYSDHTKGIEVPIAAVAMGATIIEKHFTLDRNMEGPDHKASLEPKELKEMIRCIRNIEKAIGNENKIITNSEKKNIVVARKSIVANKRIIKGEILTEDNITTKRPGNGISPMKWFDVLGTKAIKDFEEDDLIEI